MSDFAPQDAVSRIDQSFLGMDGEKQAEIEPSVSIDWSVVILCEEKGRKNGRFSALVVENRFSQAVSQTLRLSRNAWSRVPESRYSSSPPMGTPRARRVTRTSMD